jgi:hypothetical protein
MVVIHYTLHTVGHVNLLTNRMMIDVVLTVRDELYILHACQRYNTIWIIG